MAWTGGFKKYCKLGHLRDGVVKKRIGVDIVEEHYCKICQSEYKKKRTREKNLKKKQAKDGTISGRDFS